MKDILKLWNPVSDGSWGDFGSEVLYRINSKKNTSGSDRSELCEYTYNELGFRGDSIHKDGFKVMSLGCSLTEGIGVNDNETWPYYFSNSIGGVNLNFGAGGMSNDFIVRTLISYYDLIKPDLVLIMYTDYSRREYISDENGKINPFSFLPSYIDGQKNNEILLHRTLVELQNNKNDLNNWYKNHLLVKNFLEHKKCNWVWSYVFPNVGGFPNEFNRFDFALYLERVKDFAADRLHPGKSHHKKYSYNLLKFIKERFPNYLPESDNRVSDDLDFGCKRTI